MSDLPQGLPELPPVPDGYDRWEYRGKGWDSEADCVYAYYYTVDGTKFIISGGKTCAETECHYIEAVKAAPAISPIEGYEIEHEGQKSFVRTDSPIIEAAPADDAGEVLGGWPIETAPKDGTVFLAFAPHDQVGYAFACTRSTDDRWICMMSGDTQKPTRWMPMPDFASGIYMGGLTVKTLFDAMPSDLQRKVSCHDLKRTVDDYNALIAADRRGL